MIDEKVLIEKLEKERKEYQKNWDEFGNEDSFGGIHATKKAIKIVNQLAEEHNNGWIPCSEELPPMPKENPLFENKPLELYLVSLNSTDYPWRAFWNGKFFTDGFSKVEPIAWQPLPAPYKGEQK